jgi:hypothetical protein
MTTTVKADSRSRITLRGAKDGQQYVVSELAGGWIVRPSRRQRHPGLSGAEFDRLWQRREALDAETASEVSANVRQAREASRARVA